MSDKCTHCGTNLPGSRIGMSINGRPVEWRHDDCVRALRCEIERLRAFVASQPCDCYDEYGKRLPQPCERCRLHYGKETWSEFEKEDRA